MGASNTPWVQPRHPGGIDTLATSIREPSFALNDVDDKLAAQEHDGALVAHLLERESLTRVSFSCPSETANLAAFGQCTKPSRNLGCR